MVPDLIFLESWLYHFWDCGFGLNLGSVLGECSKGFSTKLTLKRQSIMDLKIYQ